MVSARMTSLGAASTRLLAEIYRVVLATRIVDERLWLLSRQGRAGFVLTARGHEVAQVASAASIRAGFDTVWLYYRDMGVGMALGISPYEIFLGALARAADPHSGGRQLTAHFSSPEKRIGPISSEIAAHIPHAVGAAYAARVKGEDSVAFCYFGEGATSEGATHEAMNIAGIHRLPVVFICENNGISISVPASRQVAVKSVADRAAGYAMPGISVDGTDWSEIWTATEVAASRARSGLGPTLIEARVPRITPHSSQDDDAYRSDALRAQANAADPLPRIRAQAIEAGALTEAADAEMTGRLREAILAAEDLALLQDEPGPERARRWLYAGDERLRLEIPDAQPWKGLEL
jgi:2-oxoisovalerate dehydrogenase E1 component alpha subunit